MRRIMNYRFPRHEDRWHADPHKMPKAVQYWIILLLVGFAGSTALIGWWAANTNPRLHLSADTILYRAIALELLLTTICALIVHYIVTRYLLAPLKHQAHYDDLTDLLRPGAFWERAEAAIAQAAAMAVPISFVFLDLDDFKQVNDTYGHAMGDAMLQAFGRVLLEHARSDDIVGRLGGEEFGWLMKGTSSSDARTATLRVLNVCRTLCIEEIAGFAFSAGIASDTPTADNSPRAWDLARHADLGLYEAKANGKAQVVVKNPNEPLRA